MRKLRESLLHGGFFCVIVFECVQGAHNPINHIYPAHAGARTDKGWQGGARYMADNQMEVES